MVNRRVAILMASLALGLFAGPVRADAEDLLTANIPFKFVAAGTSHEAGAYKLRVSDDRESVELRPPGDFVLVLTRLAPPHAKLPEGRLVFDKVGDTYTLAEMWLPGEDGFLLNVTKDKHTHHTTPLRSEAK